MSQVKKANNGCAKVLGGKRGVLWDCATVVAKLPGLRTMELYLRQNSTSEFDI